MSGFFKAIKPHVGREIDLSVLCRNNTEFDREFHHLENAHVLGQMSTLLHVRVHWLMLRWGLRQKNVREVLGQMARIFGALTKTVLRLVPEGNTGGSNISPFKTLPIAPELQSIIKRARQNG